MKTKLLSLLFALVVGVNTVDAQMTVNGRPATKEEKAVAGQMVKQGVQMAKKGANAGNPFWACTGYPDCNGTRNYTM